MLELFPVPQEVPGLEVRIFVALAFTAAAAYYDVFNKKWVPNYLVYAFIAVAVALNLLFFDPSISAQALIFGAAAFALTYGLYKIGQLGGADVYVLASIAACLPYLPKPLLSAPQHVPYPFMLSVLAPTGVLFILHMVLRFVPLVFCQLSEGKVKFSIQKIAGPVMLAIAFSLFIATLLSLPIILPPSYVAMLLLLFAALLFFTLFKDEIKSSMVEEVPAAKLQEEDVLALEKMDQRLVKRLALQPLLTPKAIALLRKSKLKRVPVYTKMPFFLPYLLFGLLFSVLFGDLLYHILQV